MKNFYLDIVIKPYLITLIKSFKSKTRREGKETNWGLCFSFAIKDSIWFKKTAINPGRWAMGFPALYALYRILNDIHPKNILEFGLGESSKFTSQYQMVFTDANLTIIEHDLTWYETFNNNIFSVSDYVSILPIVKEKWFGKKCYTYENLMPVIKGHKYDFVIIDGPWGSNSFSRPQIIDIIENDLLDKQFIILLDDVERYGERQTLELIYKTLNKKGIGFNKGLYTGVKETVVITSNNYRFLTSM